jgi:cell filamentation protein
MTSNKDKYQLIDEVQNVIIPQNIPGYTDMGQLARAETAGFIEAEASLLEELTDNTIFDRNYIREINRRALQHLYTDAGEYRSDNIFEEDSGEIRYAAAQAVPQAMNNLENTFLVRLPDRYEFREELVHDIGTIHAELLFIHPFTRGNGRTMRILANMMSLKAGYDVINYERLANDPILLKRYRNSIQAVLDENYMPMIELIDELLSPAEVPLNHP